jgi:Holliday junction resolvase RusA-like endonuclease
MMTRCRIGGRDIDLNIEKRVGGGPSTERVLPPKYDANRSVGKLDNPAPSPLILLLGQLPSGKNALMVTRTGHHYPRARFQAWRDDAMVQLKALGCIPRKAIDYPCHFKAWYWAGDKRIRDVSGMQDALYHLLEHSKILTNDGLIRDVTWKYQGLNRKNPKVEFLLSPME